MKKTFRFLALLGILAVSLFPTVTPSYAAGNCEYIDGAACTQRYATTYCRWVEDDTGYSVWNRCHCDYHGTASLFWGCRPSTPGNEPEP